MLVINGYVHTYLIRFKSGKEFRIFSKVVGLDQHVNTVLFTSQKTWPEVMTTTGKQLINPRAIKQILYKGRIQ